jgi:serine/threonine protein kinase
MRNAPQVGVGQLILDEIGNKNVAAATQRLMGSSAEERTDAAELILLNILDHISENGHTDDGLQFRVDCDAAIDRLSGVADAFTPSIVGILGLICVNVRLLEARFMEPGTASERDKFQRETQEYCEKKFQELPIADAVHALYSPARSAGQARQASPSSSPERERQKRQAEQGAWDDIDFGTIEYHKSGTTSFILKCGSVKPVDESGARRTYALKCVLFPWNKLTAIAAATDRYADYYGRSRTPDIVVQPWASTTRWVLMPFQEGTTLYDHLDDFEKGKLSVRDRIDKALSIGSLIIQTLTALAQGGEITEDHKERQHQDLSPGNIIIVSEDQARLIDLGPNHLYTRQIGITEHDDAAYVAPEIKNRGWSAIADVYSLGIILIRIICGYAPRDGRVPDEVWNTSPQLARLIEDLVEANPERRLLLTRYSPGAPYSYGPLRELFDYTAQVVSGDPDISAATRIRWASRLLPSSREPTAQLKRWLLSRRRHAGDAPRESYLLFFTLVATVCWWFIFARTALFSWADVVTFQQEPPPHGAELAADIICFNQGIIGAKFYSAILANLTVWEIPGPLAKVTEVFIRSMALVALPITAVSLFWKPWLWSWAIAGGAIAVVLANWLMLVLAQRIYGAGARNRLSIAPPDATLNARGFEQWWWTMLLYAFVLAVIALGLQLHWMKDTSAYVFGLTVISIGIHYLSKFVAAGAAVRGGLARAFSTGERMQILCERDKKPLSEWPPRLATGKLREFVSGARRDLVTLFTGS